mmetsp:Transcript_112918/g.364500  ORF Transcript_112918/g.364500 Transcript_112918/m.364500 type:complete len:204 (+) Transcript_112918:410-1021(+)
MGRSGLSQTRTGTPSWSPRRCPAPQWPRCAGGGTPWSRSGRHRCACGRRRPPCRARPRASCSRLARRRPAAQAISPRSTRSRRSSRPSRPTSARPGGSSGPAPCGLGRGSSRTPGRAAPATRGCRRCWRRGRRRRHCGWTTCHCARPCTSSARRTLPCAGCSRRCWGAVRFGHRRLATAGRRQRRHWAHPHRRVTHPCAWSCR